MGRPVFLQEGTKQGQEPQTRFPWAQARNNARDADPGPTGCRQGCGQRRMRSEVKNCRFGWVRRGCGGGGVGRGRGMGSEAGMRVRGWK